MNTKNAQVSRSVSPRSAGRKGELRRWTRGLFAAAAIVAGSLVCLRQTELKRLIAYSSVGHMGFVLLGIATLTATGLCVEVADWHRFTGATIGSYLGLVPSESSSGSRRTTRSPRSAAGPSQPGRCVRRSPRTRRPGRRAGRRRRSGRCARRGPSGPGSRRCCAA